MALIVKILAVEEKKNNDTLNNQILLLKDSINYIGLTSIKISKCNKEKIKKQLTFLCDKNKDDIIILMGNTTIFLKLSDVAYEAIEEVIDKNISMDINVSISQLTKELTHLFHRFICGILKQTLIINMCGPYATAIISLKKSYELIKQIIYSRLIESHKNYALKNDDNSDEMLYDNDSDDGEENMKNITNVIYKKQKQNFLISVREAIDIIHIVISDTYISDNYIIEKIVKTNDAYGRILAREAHSPINVPSCKTSAKHGYAVLASDGKGVRRVLKAHPSLAKISVVPGTCVRVRSGDPIPNGANAVVTPENVKIFGKYSDNNDDCFNIDDREYKIAVLLVPEINDNIRDVGYEIEHFQLIVQKFSRLGPAELGILTLCGINLVPVIELPSVGLLSISSELKVPGNALTLRCIYDSNRITLTSLLKENGYDPIDFGISVYKLNAMIKNIEDALDKVDILVIMGRANDKDILKPILKEYFNATIYFGRLDMKPGKSTTFASCTYNNRKKFFLCMSANPATVPLSRMYCFCHF